MFELLAAGLALSGLNGRADITRPRLVRLLPEWSGFAAKHVRRTLRAAGSMDLSLSLS